jgi:hypothetical protein
MTFDTSSLFGIEANDVKPEKLPTLGQYLKRNKEPKSKPLHTVRLVWIPGKFDNFTLQTDVYRIIVNPKHPFYQLLSQFFGDPSTAEIPIAIRITDWAKGSYQLEEPKRENGVWGEIGTSGYRWRSDD